MCGRFNVTDDPLTRMLCEQLGLFNQQSNLRFSEDVAPASTISIVKQDQTARTISDATWWLLMENTENGFKANYKYASFNSRSDKLNNPRAIAYRPYRESRCIIPASGFVEGQDKIYHHLKPVQSAIAFGGIYKTWVNEYTGEFLHSASIITLPGHPQFEHIHRKSLPLMLPVDNKPLIDAWLDPAYNQVENFSDFLLPTLRQSFTATPVDKPSKRNPIGLIETIPAD
jgi:putative SOS response-associated peptidase YedK